MQEASRANRDLSMSHTHPAMCTDTASYLIHDAIMVINYALIRVPEMLDVVRLILTIILTLTVKQASQVTHTVCASHSLSEKGAVCVNILTAELTIFCSLELVYS